MHKEILNHQWKTILESAQLADFKSFWQLDRETWFEPPNIRRGGWSGVSRISLPDGRALFVKRQENHAHRSLYKCFRRVATFEREFDNLNMFTQLQIPTLELVYFGVNQQGQDLQAVIVTAELTGLQPLSHAGFQPTALDRSQKNILFQQVANAIRQMHVHHIQHSCLYPKHIFARFTAGGAEVRLIDLEKAKKRISGFSARMHDLCTLHRHSEHWRSTDRLRFFLAYCQKSKLDADAKKLLRAILKRTRKKNKSPK